MALALQAERGFPNRACAEGEKRFAVPRLYPTLSDFITLASAS